MLEQSGFLLQSEGEAGPAPVWWRIGIVDATTGAPLGLARRQGGHGRLAWLRWWAPPLLRVHESDDEPLLMTVRRGWGTRWIVRDADGLAVGRLRGGVLFDRKDRPLARLRRSPDGLTATYEDSSGQTLATTTCVASAVHLSFLPDCPNSPFARMVLLAAALVHNEDILIP